MDLTTLSVVSADHEIGWQQLDPPMVLSSGTISQLPTVTVRLRVASGTAEAEGIGTVNLSDGWAWPGDQPSSTDKQTAMIAYCQRISDQIRDRTGPAAHPLELGIRLHHSVAEDHDDPAPLLARSVCASPFDAALHDAAGRLIEASAFSFYDDDAAIPSLDGMLDGSATGAIRAVLRSPVASLPGWWAVAIGDDLEGVNDQLARTGMYQIKLKVSGADPAADAVRVGEVWDAVQSSRGQQSPAIRLSVDPNEGAPDPETTEAFLQILADHHPAAFAAIGYLEQPTPRARLGEHRLDGVARRAPVMLDEGLGQLSDLELARKQGWSGYALKTCKGHSFALAAAAWAHRQRMPLSVQDLTNTGISAIHSFLLAAHLPTINGVELNSPQYLSQANDPWLPRLSGLFEVTDGCHHLDPRKVIGLGSAL